MPNRDLVFISYAKEDEEYAIKIYNELKKRNLIVWLDKMDLKVGVWYSQIMRTIAHSRYFVFCLSNNSLKKTSLEKPGFADSELQRAVEIAVKQPESEFTIVPVRLENCGRGDHRLSVHQQFDLFNNFELELNNLAINLGGISLRDSKVTDKRTEEDKLIDSFLGKATTYYYSGEYKLALLLVETILKVQNNDYRAWNIKGLSLYELGEKTKSVLAFKKVIEYKPNELYAWYNKGCILFELNNEYEALDAMNKTIEIYSESESSLKKQYIAGVFVKNKNASKFLLELSKSYNVRLEKIGEDLRKSVDSWIDTAHFDHMFGHNSMSMDEYYENEVRSDYTGYREQMSKLENEKSYIENKISILGEIEELIKQNV